MATAVKIKSIEKITHDVLHIVAQKPEMDTISYCTYIFVSPQIANIPTVSVRKRQILGGFGGSALILHGSGTTRSC